MRRLAAWLLTAGTLLVASGTAAGCSAAPGLAYAQGATRPSASVGRSAASATAKVPASARPKTEPARPGLTVSGAPSGVKAKAGILIDAATGQVLWARNADAVRPIASIAKVMSALVILQAGGLNRKIVVPAAVTGYVAKNQANAAGLIPGQVFTADQLLHVMMVVSAADAAYALASAYGPGLPGFIAKMNAEAARLGLAHTHFTSPDGLPYPTETSTYSTAAELVRLGEAAMGYPEFRSVVDLRAYNLPRGAGHDAISVSTDSYFLRTYPGAVGIKTGFTNAAGHTLLFEAVRGGRTLTGDVLGSSVNGFAAAALDSANVLNWGFSLKQPS